MALTRMSTHVFRKLRSNMTQLGVRKVPVPEVAKLRQGAPTSLPKLGSPECCRTEKALKKKP